MTAPFRIALAQFDFPIGAVAANRARIGQLAARARDEAGANVLVCPALALSGCAPGDLLHQPGFLAACEEALAALALETRGITLVVGHPERGGDGVFNAVSVLREGSVVATFRQDEFASGPGGAAACVVDMAGLPVALLPGDAVLEPVMLSQAVAGGARLVLVPAARPFSLDEISALDRTLTRRAGEAGCAVALARAVGGHDQWLFAGGSLLLDADGQAHPPGPMFADALLLADFDAEVGSFTPCGWPELAPPEPGPELLWQALVRATRDFVQHNGADKVWLGLSGGLDSAVVLALAVDALGADKVRAVAMPSRYTTDISNSLAAEGAANLGVRLDSLPIEATYTSFLDTLTPLFAGHEPNVAEENLQARCRGTLLMALSNKFGGLVLATGNKSEAAVGYSTLYGDTCGSFAPLADVYKTQVFALARWRNQQAGRDIIPQGIIDRPPSAELREGQADSDSLPPYDVLDEILQRFLAGGQSRRDIVAAGFDDAVVARVLGLVLASEFKRNQEPPGPRVSSSAFGTDIELPASNAWRG